jgi:peptide/nickel transport system substrate-binding protein
MISRALKLRFRRRLRMRKLQVEELGQQAEQQLELNFFRRLERLADVRRFVATWIILLVLLGGVVIAQTRGLAGYYQTPEPVAGGTYHEGILGSFTNANPIYATSPVDTAVSRLVFSSLATYDANGELVGDLATGWTLDKKETTYTVNLRPNAAWHDGKPVTASDVVFTYQLIQNADTQSPLRTSWQGIQVTEANPSTVIFKLPTPLVSFPYSLTNGIVPKHILQDQAPSALRTLLFNSTDAIGSGPFMLDAIEVHGGSAQNREERLALTPFKKYHQGMPKLDQFVIHAFRSEQRLIDSFREQQINAISGLTDVPGVLAEDGNVRIHNFPLTAQVMTFFRTKAAALSDVNVRRSLVLATDKDAIIKDLDFPTQPIRSPILPGQVGYSKTRLQPSFDLQRAKELLSSKGWKLGDNGIRKKGTVELSFTLHAQDNSEYGRVARMLQEQWRAIGADVRVVLQSSTDFQTTVSLHGYDALLYGIAVGKDSDVYVYWDSKHADVLSDNRLNFSEFSSKVADEALQAGRTRSNAALRAIKYRPFLDEWREQAPAVGLYQPRYLYVTRGPVYGLNEDIITGEVQRYANVHNWMIRQTGAPQAK